MRDIKMKEHGQKPKTRNPAARKPKELVRAAVLEAKTKSGRAADAASAGESQISPTEYAGERLASAEEWAAGKAGDSVVLAGRKLARRSHEKIRVRKKEAETAEAAAEEAAGDAARETAQGAGDTAVGTEKSRHPAGKQRDGSLQGQKETLSPSQMASQGKVKVKPESKEFIRTAAGRDVKTAPRVVRTSPMSADKIKTGQTVAKQKQALHAMRSARRAAAKAAESAGKTKTAGKTAKTTIRGMKAAIRGAVTSVKALGTLSASAGGFLVVFFVIVGVIAGAAFSGSSQSAEPLSQEVLSYTPTIQKYAAEYGIPEYVSVLQAIMMQESGGRGTDPMQSSECPYNTKFPNSPNAISEPEYSIQVGVQYYASCVAEAGCESPSDMNKLKLSLQGYNYGNGYITWAIRNYGGYSEANALQFSQEQAASHGWARYGDPEYVPHVLRYYSGGGSLFAGLFGNEQIVTIAKTQLGNEGGQKFWSWYGFVRREPWCACFVSWCAEKSGLIESGSIPKFAYCPAGIDWFKSKGRWKDRGDYTPVAGTLIFFDWPEEGVFDGVSDHVGIVEKCENGIVYTVEGNSGDAVRERRYPINSESILGYGIIY
ncbi:MULTISPECIES: lysozyme family protein [Clostridia]|uniref:lysozyme family protein n=1 Tax=Clostridia TaxID=186801 RepID=UPI00067EE09B|nr:MULTISPECIES: lysozyme family protein [Clostridia]